MNKKLIYYYNKPKPWIGIIMLTAKMKYRLILRNSKDKPNYGNLAESHYKSSFLNNFSRLKSRHLL